MIVKLISCYIDNYGKISNQTFYFNDNLTCIFGNNGFGKSTLASFIRAMFYGLNSVKSNSKNFDDRQRFYPYSKANFGGSITFEFNDSIYKLERYFDEKSESKDSVTTYINDALVDNIENMPTYFFGLDQNSFNKTIFFNNEDIRDFKTADINNKLYNFVENTSNENNCEKSIELLDKLQTNLKAKRGKSGLISQLTMEISQLESQINNLNDINSTLQATYQKRNELTKTLENLQLKLKQFNKQKALKEIWENYDSLTSELTNLKQSLDNIKRNYPLGVVDSQTLEKIKQLYDEILCLSGQLKANVFTSEKQNKLDLLNNFFIDGVPQEKTLEDIENTINQVNVISLKIDSKNNELSSTQKSIYEKFNKIDICEKNILNYEQKTNEYKNLLNKKDQKNKTVINAKHLIINLFAILFVAFGFIIFSNNSVVGAISCILGVVIFCCFIISFIKDNNKLKQQNNDLNKRIKVLNDEITAFLQSANYLTDNGLFFDFATLKNDFLQYTEINESLLENEKNTQKDKRTLQDKNEFLQNFFEKYNLNGSFGKQLTTLNNNIKEYESLKNDKLQVDKQKDYIMQQGKNAKQQLLDLLNAFAIEPDGDLNNVIDKIAKDCNTINQLQKQIAEKNNQIIQYKQQKNLDERPKFDNLYENLEGEINDCNNQIAICDNQIAFNESQTQTLTDKQTALENKMQQLSNYNDKYDVIEKTIEHLKLADKTLIERYVSPIKRSFITYYNMVNDGDCNVALDKDFNLRFEVLGKNRDNKHLSSGEWAVVSLCLRFALIENMYQKEQPFIILDDPFVNLDDAHIKKVLNCVKSLSNKKQIIYFCCHESRKIN